VYFKFEQRISGVKDPQSAEAVFIQRFLMIENERRPSWVSFVTIFLPVE